MSLPAMVRLRGLEMSFSHDDMVKLYNVANQVTRLKRPSIEDQTPEQKEIFLLSNRLTTLLVVKASPDAIRDLILDIQVALLNWEG